MADKRIDDIVKRLDRMETKLDELRESWWKFEGARLAFSAVYANAKRIQ